MSSSSVDRPSGGPAWHSTLRARGGGMRISFAKKDGASSGGSSPTGSTPSTAVDPSALGLDAERRYEEARARIFGSADEETSTANVPQHVHTHGPAHRDGTSDFVGFTGRQGYDDDFARGTHIWAGIPSNGAVASSAMPSNTYSNTPYQGESGGPVNNNNRTTVPGLYPSAHELHSMLSALLFAPTHGAPAAQSAPDS